VGVKALLDTHTLLWALFEPEKLGEQARKILLEEDAELFISPVSFFEMAQKIRVGKLPITEDLLRELPGICREQGWRILELNEQSAIDAGLFSSNHRDPFDRLLAAQAYTMDCCLL
jgi:PIN domain nuclease of toxin-antitoxin system